MIDSATILQDLSQCLPGLQINFFPLVLIFTHRPLHIKAKCQACLTSSTDTSIPADNYHKEIDALVCRGEFNLL